MAEQIATNAHKVLDSLKRGHALGLARLKSWRLVDSMAADGAAPDKSKWLVDWTTEFLESPETQFFVFDEFTFSEGLATEVSEAYHLGLVDLPFPRVVFEHFFPQEQSQCVYLFEKTDRGIRGAEFRRPAGVDFFLSTGFVATMLSCRDVEGAFRYTASIASCPHIWIGDADASSREIGNLFDSLFTLLGVLNATGAHREMIAAPAKLNAQRARRSKPLVPGHRRVILRPASSIASVIGAAGGGHASPRMHVRRGHIRRLETGKMTWVRPCVVGDPGRGAVSHSYVVQGAGREA